MRKVFLFSVILFFTGCKQIDLFEKNTPIPGYKWYADFSADGSFDIKDTTGYYNLYIVLRHSDRYKYNNIWLNIGLQPPGDSMSYQRFDLQLATDAAGWFGTGMDDIWDVKEILNPTPSHFKKAGKYNFSIKQLMRDNPLPEVLSAGLRIEKVKN